MAEEQESQQSAFKVWSQYYTIENYVGINIYLLRKI